MLERGPGWGTGGGEEGDWHCLPEADDSSVFVVGTVLYRNLGSFLALQRWALRARGGGGGARPDLGWGARGVGCQRPSASGLRERGSRTR